MFPGTYLTRSAMLEAKALVMREPAALEPRCPNVSIHDLHLNLMLLPVIWGVQGIGYAGNRVSTGFKVQSTGEGDVVNIVACNVQRAGYRA
jgi:hypothetical protein